MKYIVISDSSSNVIRMEDPRYVSVPMKVRADREYVDDDNLDVAAMVAELKVHKGRSGSSCPNVGEWVEAFGDADCVFGLTISKNLSGSYNSACQAAAAYREEHPQARVHIFDTLTAGPQQAMLADKILELCSQGLPFTEIVEKVTDYQNHTHLLFCLESMMNLARNGRVSMAIAKLAGMLGIRVCGAAENGQIVAVHKPRGNRKTTDMLVEMIKARGFRDGCMLRIAHCFGEEAACALRDAVLAQFPNTRFRLEPTTALCSYYAEEGGLMIGFEGGFNEKNHV